jgi:hypothetical protein
MRNGSLERAEASFGEEKAVASYRTPKVTFGFEAG